MRERGADQDMAGWDPTTYLRFADERSRPFYDLTARVATTDPGTVVDLGCGPGQLTAELAERWPDADVVGIDSSPEMVSAAAEHAGPRLRFEVGDLAEWRPTHPVDVIISNATLQWVPGHRTLLPHLVESLSDGGWLAFQVPGNFGEPSHRLLRRLAADTRFADATRDVVFPSSSPPETYLADLTQLGCTVDAWETTYLHVLTGPDPIFHWISGTGARPVLQALRGPLLEEFVTEYKALLLEAYPSSDVGTVLPFRRIFCVGHREAEAR
jgi:trans-aconitate 2-methyltransferase